MPICKKSTAFGQGFCRPSSPGPVKNNPLCASVSPWFHFKRQTRGPPTCNCALMQPGIPQATCHTRGCLDDYPRVHRSSLANLRVLRVFVVHKKLSGERAIKRSLYGRLRRAHPYTAAVAKRHPAFSGKVFDHAVIRLSVLHGRIDVHNDQLIDFLHRVYGIAHIPWTGEVDPLLATLSPWDSDRQFDVLKE